MVLRIDKILGFEKFCCSSSSKSHPNQSSRYTQTHIHTNYRIYNNIITGVQTRSMGTLAECDKVHDAVLHLQHGGALAVEHGDAVRAPRLVRGQPAREHH